MADLYRRSTLRARSALTRAAAEHLLSRVTCSVLEGVIVRRIVRALDDVDAVFLAEHAPMGRISDERQWLDVVEAILVGAEHQCTTLLTIFNDAAIWRTQQGRSGESFHAGQPR